MMLDSLGLVCVAASSQLAVITSRIKSFSVSGSFGLSYNKKCYKTVVVE